jgi:DNA-binding NtrC family response regulator
LLRVLESGEYIKVGSSKVLKTDVRVIAATNVNIPEAIKKGKFREDLYYRLNTIPIIVPPLRNRGNDMVLLFKKFAMDMAEKYQMPPIKLTPEAEEVLVQYRWPGNIRQLKNISEQICVLEEKRSIDGDTLLKYIPDAQGDSLPVLFNKINSFTSSDGKLDEEEFKREREIFYKVLFDMKTDINELKKLLVDIIQNGTENINIEDKALVQKIFEDVQQQDKSSLVFNAPLHKNTSFVRPSVDFVEDEFEDSEELVEESFSLVDKEKELIVKALEKCKGKRKIAAKELGISERTLYRKIKEFNLDL